MFESCNPDSSSLALPVVMFLFGGILSTVNDLIKPSFLCPPLGAKKKKGGVFLFLLSRLSAVVSYFCLKLEEE